ncbi:uncharacterized protein CBL_08925 [Carabus blaptoides fortunei]
MSTEEKFHAAVNVIRSLPKNGSYQPSNELMLRFYAFFKQATLGPCKGSRPAFWDVVGRAKYDAWKKLDDMGKHEAMSNYVAELHRIVETMSYNDNVANFLEAQTELESVPIGDLELIAGDVIERVRSQPNSPFASREASPQRLRSSLETTPASSQCSPSTSPPPQDESDDEYIDTIDDFATKKTIPNGYIPENIPNGHGPQTSHSRSSRSKTKTTPGFQPITPTAATTRAQLSMIISACEALNLSNSKNDNSVFEAMPALIKSSSSDNWPTVSTCTWARGLCGGPDVPVANNGGPPLVAKRLTFRTRLTAAAAGSTACWDTVLIGRTLYVALPPHILPEGSRDAFVALLEAAEEKLNCEHVVVVFDADRSDRAMLVRTFMFLGFAVLSPTSPLVPPGLTGNVCMLYNIE